MSAAATISTETFLHTRRRLTVGVDLGQSKDPTSIAVIEKTSREVDVGAPLAYLPSLRATLRDDRPVYRLHALQQAPLGESYPAQAERLKRLLALRAIAEHDPDVWIDYTGVGRAVYDIFKQERVPNIQPVTITFGGQPGPNGHGGHSVPKLELVSRLQALMHSGRLLMSPNLLLAKAFRRELADFRVSYTAVGNATFGAREGAHDDLVLAVALAVYGLDSEQGIEVSPLRM
ncbi:hypothetical protein SAMN02800694_2762 [Luteibacter sp. UNCMF331Sha3.1]|uniref:hypothetical protein n=1 Tax=Luteibacter sp. UNCMF331Sha3.1 TaxID=1502760 RepID=UPI0008D78DB4|nr:hypothetical protein [Luteibacter sp. UNCMF331Sha3.1]SEN09796.1 hypothetical protein SAMN02800694_2762 [Luteibacter sp. UNCMF331Sha3.1]